MYLATTGIILCTLGIRVPLQKVIDSGEGDDGPGADDAGLPSQTGRMPLAERDSRVPGQSRPNGAQTNPLRQQSAGIELSDT